MTRAWMIRAEGGRMLEQFLARGLVSVGWGEAGDITAAPDRAAIEAALRKAGAPGARWGASVLWRFLHEMQEGDTIVTYDGERRLYHVGTVAGPARHDPEGAVTAGTGEDRIVHPYLMPVRWTHAVFRDDLSPALRNTLGAISTLFRIRDRVEELAAPRRPPAEAPAPAAAPAPPPAEPGSGEATTLQDLAERARAAVEDAVAALDDRQMEQLVAGVLRAMGYRTRVAQRGRDRGADILASPDGFGFQDPRIVVEVKHRPRQATDAPMLRAFLGGRRPGDRGLYVSTGGFTADARYEADRAAIPLSLMTLADLVDEIIARYEAMDAEARALLPLRRLYWPEG